MPAAAEFVCNSANVPDILAAKADFKTSVRAFTDKNCDFNAVDITNTVNNAFAILVCCIKAQHLSSCKHAYADSAFILKTNP